MVQIHTVVNTTPLYQFAGKELQDYLKQPTKIEPDKDNSMQKAIEFAVKAHIGQFRKDGETPYIFHPFDVFSLVRNWGITDQDIWKACLCHDILEDCPKVTNDELIQEIGTKAAKICEELTFIPDKNSEIHVNMQKSKYMKSFMDKSIEAIIIKCADRICNTLDFKRESPSYAPSYWSKAFRLFEAYEKKSYKIQLAYGYQTSYSMNLAIENMDISFRS